MRDIKRAKDGNGSEERYSSIISKHLKSLGWLREELLEMDALANPIMGVNSWDDAVVVDFGGKRLVASTDGPYKKRLVMKSALIHAATDVVVKGARPLFCLDTVTGREEDVREMIASLKKQALAMKIPILGGNTMIEDVEPTCSLTVFGELLLDEPIRDCGAKKGDVLTLLGEPIWGEQDERIEKAQKMFAAWFEMLGKGVKINAAKDVTKGGLVSAVYEICEKSGVKYEFENNIPFSMTRNLDNFLISVSGREFEAIRLLCEKQGCSVYAVGRVL